MPVKYSGVLFLEGYNTDPMVLVGEAKFKPKKAGPNGAGSLLADHTCEQCRYNAKCKEREKLGLWMMCEIPDEYDLEIAKRLYEQAA